jgi:hypothetical protein
MFEGGLRKLDAQGTTHNFDSRHASTRLLMNALLSTAARVHEEEALYKYLVGSWVDLDEEMSKITYGNSIGNTTCELNMIKTTLSALG